MCRTQPFVGVLEERPEVVEVGRGVAHDALGAVDARGMIPITMMPGSFEIKIENTDWER